MNKEIAYLSVFNTVVKCLTILFSAGDFPDKSRVQCLGLIKATPKKKKASGNLVKLFSIIQSSILSRNRHIRLPRPGHTLTLHMCTTLPNDLTI